MQRHLTVSLPFHHESEVTLGEFKVNFNGRDRVQVKRKALDYWYDNRDKLQLSMRDFFSRCRMSRDERTITFSISNSGNLRST
jgi:hypothetical protein